MKDQLDVTCYFYFTSYVLNINNVLITKQPMKNTTHKGTQ